MGSWYRVERNEDVPDTWTVYLHDEIGSYGITSATYMDYIPKQPVHGNKTPALRQYLFYDWSVRSMRTPK